MKYIYLTLLTPLIILVVFCIFAFIAGRRHEKAHPSDDDLRIKDSKQIEIKNIKDGDLFYKWVFSSVPDGSVLSVEDSLGGDTKKAFQALKKFSAFDDAKVPVGTIWPKAPIIKVLLSKYNKPRLLELFKDPIFGYREFKFPIMHSHVYHHKTMLVETYDNLDDAILSSDLPQVKIEQAIKTGLFEIANKQKNLGSN